MDVAHDRIELGSGLQGPRIDGDQAIAATKHEAQHPWLQKRRPITFPIVLPRAPVARTTCSAARAKGRRTSEPRPVAACECRSKDRGAVEWRLRPIGLHGSVGVRFASPAAIAVAAVAASPRTSEYASPSRPIVRKASDQADRSGPRRPRAASTCLGCIGRVHGEPKTDQLDLSRSDHVTGSPICRECDRRAQQIAQGPRPCATGY